MHRRTRALCHPVPGKETPVRQPRSVTTLSLAAVAAVSVLAVAACGAKSEGGSGSSSGSSKHIVKIGLIAPLTGSLSALGLGMRNSEQLAIDQANAANKIPGWTIQFDPQDDAESTSTGQAAATTLASDPAVGGVVGTLQSSIALVAVPVLNKADIVMVSPANTNPALTQGQNYQSGTKSRPFANYFRVCTTDAIQGPFAADYASQKLGAKSVYLVNDKLVYGVGLTTAFKGEFTKDGGTVAGSAQVSTGQTDFGALVTKVLAAKPDLVYYGGQYPEGAPFDKQLIAAGYKGAFMGGDGLDDPTFIKDIGAQTADAYATNVGAAVQDLPGAAAYVKAYDAAYPNTPFSAYGPNTYDATDVIINALAKSLAGKTAIDQSVRQATIADTATENFTGITGTVSFDQYGDTTNKVLTMYKVESGAFTKEETGTFSG